MNASWGWALAALAVVVGWMQWGWQGVLMAVTLITFWLLLQFNRAVRVMRQASGAPVGHVASAVMLHSRLRPGMRLMEIIPLTHSLGQRADDAATADPAVERFVWTDASGASVSVELARGRLRSWVLQRPPAEGDA